MNDFLYFCPTCKTIYEITRHHIRPPAEPVCEGCQQQLPLADDADWLTYRRTRPRLEPVEQRGLLAASRPVVVRWQPIRPA